MLELLAAALEPVSILFTVLLAFVLLYWLSVIVGALEISTFDIDLDFDFDGDADANSSAEGGSGGWLAGALHFFNFGRLPLMVILSVTVLAAWGLSILGNYYLGHNSWLFAIATLIPNVFISLLLAKLITSPLIPLFERLDQTQEDVDYIGMSCKIRLPASASRFGQAEVLIDDASLLILVKTENDDLRLASGEEAVVVGKTADERYFLVKKLEKD